MTAKRVCCLCDKPLATSCKCPWKDPFDQWPRDLANQVRAIVAQPKT